MRIGGLQKQSLIDWDGRMVAVVFTQGCNFRCGYCHNPSLVLPDLMEKEKGVPEAEVLAFLKSRAGWLDGVVVSGGEPTIQPDLKTFLQKIKNLGLAIKLDTNGTNPDVLIDLIDSQLVDFVAMDVKTVPTIERYSMVTPLSEKLMERVRHSLGVLEQGRVDYQLRTTIIPLIHTPSDIESLERLAIRNKNYRFQEFREGNTIEEVCAMFQE